MENIIYSIGTGEGSLVQYQTEILQNDDILLIWIPILLIISLGLTYLWWQKELYGTFKLKVLQTVLFERKIPIQKNINFTLRRVSNQEVEEIKKTNFNWSTKYFWKAAT
ncbi:putative ABC transporter [Spiroplasma kunkelii CR2-3x]|uniref:Putative ABC transporter n=2 Tax=Spiroplasma kunkelii TaxID=47834 RepID=A0A0K2JIX4_SPIKU|nr:putative ABC transporter [Spiroplasma kunkelii CR2-3x]